MEKNETCVNILCRTQFIYLKNCDKNKKYEFKFSFLFEKSKFLRFRHLFRVISGQVTNGLHARPAGFSSFFHALTEKKEFCEYGARITTRFKPCF